MSGGVHISGSIGSIGGDIVGGDKITTTTTITNAGGPSEIDTALRPLTEAINRLAPEKRAEAEAKVSELKEQVAKGKDADDEKTAGIMESLVEMVPDVSKELLTVVGLPLVGAIVGPATKYVLKKLTGK